MPLVAHLSSRFHSDIGGGGGSKVCTYVCFDKALSIFYCDGLARCLATQNRFPEPATSSPVSRFEQAFPTRLVNITIVIIRSRSLLYTQKLTLELPISKAIRTSLCVRHLHMDVFVHSECLAGMKDLRIGRDCSGFAGLHHMQVYSGSDTNKKIHSQPLATAHV